jgi:hypothetical protein
MKSNILYTIVAFVLCFGIKAQAQNAVLDYNQRFLELSDFEAKNLDYLTKGAPSSMFMTSENKAKIHQGNTHEIVEMSIEKTSDFTALSTVYLDKLKEVVLINIEWDGKQQIVIPTDLIIQFKNLKYIYIRSYKELDKEIIKKDFFDLLQNLKDKEEIEILYLTMEQPS